MIITDSLKQVLYVTAFAVLGALSATACAQSNEYRQGYDQGYRDGTEAQGQPEHGPVGRIIIEEAHYGSRDGGFCDPRDSIQHAIGWRRHVDIHVGNELCGDPAPNHAKRLEVRYRCGNSQPVRAEASENSVMPLSCQ
jgi:hypothetical protein